MNTKLSATYILSTVDRGDFERRGDLQHVQEKCIMLAYTFPAHVQSHPGLW